MRGLEVQYPAVPPEEPVQVLAGIDIEFHRSQVTAIVGPSGCGKTTFLNVIAGLVAPFRGVVERAGANERIVTGYVFQDPQLLPWRTVEANALFGAEINGSLSGETRRKCQRLLQRYGLAGFHKRYPRTLSGGMQQRVALVRAALSGASILLLDEPFSNSDFLTRRALQADLLDIVRNEHVTAVLVTHDLDEAIRVGDRVIVFSQRPARVLLELTIEIPREQRLDDFAPGVLEPYLLRVLEAFNPKAFDEAAPG
jgi:NitT/TauT family transport system ATP-binding protein